VRPYLGREIRRLLDYRPSQHGWEVFRPIILIVAMIILPLSIDYYLCGPSGCAADVPAYQRPVPAPHPQEIIPAVRATAGPLENDGLAQPSQANQNQDLRPALVFETSTPSPSQPTIARPDVCHNDGPDNQLFRFGDGSFGNVNAHYASACE
jgi:hypothetical protein